MRYIRLVNDEGYRAPSEDWGKPTYWLEVTARGDAERELAEYPNGNVLSYDRTHPEDRHGALAVLVLDGTDEWSAGYEISAAEFEPKWQAHKPMNRQGLPETLVPRREPD